MPLDTAERWARYVLTGGDVAAAQDEQTVPTDDALAPLRAGVEADLVSRHPCLGDVPETTLEGSPAELAGYREGLGRLLAEEWARLGRARALASAAQVAGTKTKVQIGPVTEETMAVDPGATPEGVTGAHNRAAAQRALRRVACIRTASPRPSLFERDGARGATYRGTA